MPEAATAARAVIRSNVIGHRDRRERRPIIDWRRNEPAHDESQVVALDADDANASSQIVACDRQDTSQVRTHRWIIRR